MEKMPGTHNFESKEKLVSEAYFSVSNIVNKCYVLRADGKKEPFDIAILGGYTENGKSRFQAIGGGAKLSDSAIQQLRTEYPSIRFRAGEESDDARFYIPIPERTVVDKTSSEESQANANRARAEFVHEVMDRFNDQNSSLFKGSVEKDLTEELLKEKEGFPSPLTEEEVQNISVHYKSSVSPVQWKTTTSGRAGSSAHYYRTFFLYDMTVPESLFEKLKTSGLIKILSKEDIKAVRVATESGESVAKLSDESVIVENIFPSY